MPLTQPGPQPVHRAPRWRAMLLGALLTGAALTGAAADQRTSAAEAFAGGDFDAAIAHFEAALARSPDDHELHLGLGKALGRAAERAEWLDALRLARRARASFERAVELAPRHAPSLLALMKFYARAPAFLGGDSDKARRIAETLADIDPRAARDARAWLQGDAAPSS